MRVAPFSCSVFVLAWAVGPLSRRTWEPARLCGAPRREPHVVGARTGGAHRWTAAGAWTATAAGGGVEQWGGPSRPRGRLGSVGECSGGWIQAGATRKRGETVQRGAAPGRCKKGQKREEEPATWDRLAYKVRLRQVVGQNCDYEVKRKTNDILASSKTTMSTCPQDAHPLGRARPSPLRGCSHPHSRRLRASTGARQRPLPWPRLGRGPPSYSSLNTRALARGRLPSHGK